MRGRVVRRAALALTVASLAAMGAFVLWPLPPHLLDRAPVVSLRVLDRQGATLRELRSRADGRSVPLVGDAIPPLVEAAFLSAEDQRFWTHPGVDPLAIARAASQDLRAWRIVSGASTLTQQLARILVPRTRSLPGKVGEALWALRLTAHLSRRRILLEYLNRVALGSSTYGVEAAAQLYFGRPASSLSAGQAAMLAGMACNPQAHDPYRRRAQATARMRQVLGRMHALGKLSAEQARVASAASLDLAPPERAFDAPHFVDALLADLPALGLTQASSITTTLDSGLQADVESLVKTEIASLADKQVTQAAVLVLDNASGEVLAYVGSANFLDAAHHGQNDGVRSLRQPGSALKPFAYGLALASGHTPAEVLSDVETHLATPSGDYVPRNYDRRVHGPVRLRAALANSYNVPAIRLAETLGPERVLRLLRAAGFTSLDRPSGFYGAGIILGDGDVTLWELARAYSGLARGGRLLPLKRVRAASDPRGEKLAPRPALQAARFLPADAVNLLTDILSDETARIPAFGLDNALRLPFPVAAKTGTSRAYVDNWTAGFTRERTVAVWVGNFDGKPMQGVSGITGAGPLFKRVMIRAMRGLTPAPLVDRARLTTARICPLSGQLAGPECPGTFEERFLPGSEPHARCTMHQRVAGRSVLDVGPAFYTWAQGEGLATTPGRAAPGEAPDIALLAPGDGDEYLVEPGIPAASQTIPVRALAHVGGPKLELRLDGRAPLAFEPPFATRVEAVRGRHTLALWAQGGRAPIAVVHYVVH